MGTNGSQGTGGKQQMHGGLKARPLVYISKGKESPKNASPLGKSHNVLYGFIVYSTD